MKFEKTGLFYSLLNHFTNYGKEILNDYTRTTRANEFTAKFVKLYGVEKIAKVSAQANKMLKTKIF